MQNEPSLCWGIFVISLFLAWSAMMVAPFFIARHCRLSPHKRNPFQNYKLTEEQERELDEELCYLTAMAVLDDFEHPDRD